MTHRYTKLIRDKIPDLIPEKSRHNVSLVKERKRLAEKLMEESAEVFEALQLESRSELISELADLTEVRDQIATEFGITIDQIQNEQRRKYGLRGGLKEGFHLTQSFDEKNTRWFEGHNFTLLHFLQRQILESKRINLAVSFVMKSGLDLLENTLLEAISKGCQIKILTTDYLEVTDPLALRRLLAMGPNIELKMYQSNGRSFHPKTWLFEIKSGRQLAIVGSSNLSRSALLNGIEWNYKVLDSDHGWPMQQAWQVFDQYFHASESLSVNDQLIELYENKRVLRVPIEANDYIPAIKPNPAQKEALVELSKIRESGEIRAMVIAATGLGKTYLSALDSLPFKRVLFVAHREELLIQAEHAFKTIRPNDTTQILTRGRLINLRAQLVFASVQTLSGITNQNLIPIGHFDYIVVDEFHRAAAKSYEALFDLEFRFLLGLTATPFRLDNKDLLALCDSNVAYQINVIEAISLGWLCPFHYRGVYDATDYSKIERRAGQYSLKSLSRALNVDSRNQLAFEEYLKSNSVQALGFCISISHSESLAQYFSARGVRSISLSSKSNRDERSSAISKLISGEVRVIFTVDLFNEGVDIPTIDLVMFLRPTESVTVFLQQLGRGLRTAEGKSHLNVIDLVGNYKGADFKLPTLIGLQDWTQTDVQRIAKDILAGRVHESLPAGIQINIDDLGLEAIRAVTKQGLAGLVIEEYLRIKAELGHRPTMMEMFNNSRYSLKIYRQHYGSWLEFLSNQGEMSDQEMLLMKTHGGFLNELEKTSMTKSFKPVVILGMLEHEGFKSGITVQQLSDYFVRHYEQARNKTDLIGTEIFNIKEVSGEKLIQYLLKNPVNAWINKPFFELLDNERLVYAGSPVSNYPLFEKWVEDVARYRLEEYLASKTRQNAAHKIVWGAKETDNPLIKLDRTKSDLPCDGEFHTVLIGGEKYLAKFVKIAINVIHPINGSNNILENLIRAAHPEMSRSALSNLPVRITPIPNDVGFEIEF